jgi:Mrp family chromosome partitioning ATPase
MFLDFYHMREQLSGVTPEPRVVYLGPTHREALVSIYVVDANLRTPYLHEHFRTGKHCGLADAILGPKHIRNFAHQLNGSKVWSMACVSRTSGPHTVAALGRPHSRLAELRAEFDYVLLDSPPANLYADATPLGRLAEGAYRFCKPIPQGRKRREKLKRTSSRQRSGCGGAVLNKRAFPVPEFVYRRI